MILNRLLILAIVLAVFPILASAQDKVHLRNGQVIDCKVIEIGLSSISLVQSDGIRRTVSKSQVKAIVFQNGNVETFHEVPTFTPRLTNGDVALRGLIYTWAATTIGAVAMGDRMLSTTMIPVVGPWVTIIRVKNSPGGTFLPGGKDC
ncbi:MAG: hypothetical protein FJY67_03925 [Calditrichaeota bacterium]|nr:hypothetical protein [Calditrichota bacterium]